MKDILELGKNRVRINNDSYIVVSVVGDQTVASVEAMAEAILQCAKKLQKDGKRILVFDDLMQIGDVPPEARKRVVELGKSLRYDKLAMVGKGTALRLGANLMLTAMGKADKLKYFEDAAKATAWLDR